MTTAHHVAELEGFARSARAAANSGNWEEAARLWEMVHQRNPTDGEALFSLGAHKLRQRDFLSAARLLEMACTHAPHDALARLAFAVACRENGDAKGELAAIDEALSIDAYFLPAILAKAAWHERRGALAAAAFLYQSAIKFAPQEPMWPADLRARLTYAKSVAEQHAEALEARLGTATEALCATLPASAADRWREARAIMAGASRPYTAQCNQLHVPRLPALPFFDPSLFAWTQAIEAKTDIIRGELNAALERHSDRFTPYVAYARGAPVNQWKDLNHSKAWSAFQLWRGGAPVETHLAMCPETAKALEAVEMAEIGGLCPNAMFSMLAPHTHIPPHTGETNARLVAHLPLVVPDGCTFRVGYERRRWEVGRLLVFDDTLEHEARNDSDEPRVVLIFDVWHPYLSPAEREIAKALIAAAQAVYKE